MINAVIVVVAFFLLILQGILHRILVSQWVYPSLTLPLVLYMSVGDFSLSRGALLAFVIGYLTDVFLGIPMGLFTFSMVAVFLIARVAGLKLFLHGILFQVILTFMASLVVGGLIMGLRLIFERTHLAVVPALLLVLSQSVATALVAPLVFKLVKTLPGTEPPKIEER